MWLIYTLTAKTALLNQQCYQTPHPYTYKNNAPNQGTNSHLYLYIKTSTTSVRPSKTHSFIYIILNIYIINKYTSSQHTFKIVQYITHIVRELLSLTGEYYCYYVHHTKTLNISALVTHY
jgi:hypothetical protein